jgi:transposase
MSEDVRPTTPETLADPTAALPDDPAILQQMIIELLATLRDMRRQNEELQHRLDLLSRRLYGPRTERVDPNQPLLFPDAFEAVAPEISEPGNVVPPDPEPGAAPKKRGPTITGTESRVKLLTRVERPCRARFRIPVITMIFQPSDRFISAGEYCGSSLGFL